MIITSLNLYEFSMNNNKEMGVLIDRNDPADAQLFKDAMDEVSFIQTTSQTFDFVAQKVEPPTRAAEPAPRTPAPQADRAAPTKSTERTGGGKPHGYCIRTGVEIPFNIEKPLSYDAYKRWSVNKDPQYAEKFCHFSGEPSQGETSVSRPILKKNWKKMQEVHGGK